MLNDAGKNYGEGIIKKYSVRLISEVNKKYNVTTLKRIRQFYWIIGAPLAHQLSNAINLRIICRCFNYKS